MKNVIENLGHVLIMLGAGLIQVVAVFITLIGLVFELISCGLCNVAEYLSDFATKVSIGKSKEENDEVVEESLDG